MHWPSGNRSVKGEFFWAFSFASPCLPAAPHLFHNNTMLFTLSSMLSVLLDTSAANFFGFMGCASALVFACILREGYLFPRILFFSFEIFAEHIVGVASACVVIVVLTEKASVRLMVPPRAVLELLLWE
jgi:hypothetical protein